MTLLSDLTTIRQFQTPPLYNAVLTKDTNPSKMDVFVTGWLFDCGLGVVLKVISCTTEVHNKLLSHIVWGSWYERKVKASANIWKGNWNHDIFCIALVVRVFVHTTVFAYWKTDQKMQNILWKRNPNIFEWFLSETGQKL